mgnify:CR=1 FL=1
MTSRSIAGASALMVVICASNGLATVVDYTVASSESSLTLSASCGGLPLVGSALTQSLGGTVRADVTGSSVQFQGGTISAGNSFSGALDTGFWGWLIGMDAGVRDFSLQLGGAPIALTGGAFAANGANLGVGGVMDYTGTGLLGFLIGAGSSPLEPQTLGNSDPGAGSISSDGIAERLSIPFAADFTAALPEWLGPDWNRAHLSLSGTIVAYRDVPATPAASTIPDNLSQIPTSPTVIPEPATLALLALGGLAVMRRRR